MTALIDDVIALLRGHKLVKKIRIVHYDETPTGSVATKIRCRLKKGYQFQIWLHHESDFLDYAYQLFTNQPILRWDNSPHYPDIPTAPHHFHDEYGRVKDSMLANRPLDDLTFVLAEIEKWIDKEIGKTRS